MDGNSSSVQPVQLPAADQHPPATARVKPAVAGSPTLSPDNTPTPIQAASPANSAPPPAWAATPAAASVQSPKPAPPISPHSALRQSLQQSRSRVESSMQEQVQPCDLPVAYAVSTLAQPGAMFIKSFQETSPDSDTTLPEAHRAPAHSQASTAGQSVHPFHDCIISLPLHCGKCGKFDLADIPTVLYPTASLSAMHAGTAMLVVALLT